MKKSTKNVIGIIAGVAVATVSAILMGVNAKKEDSECIEADFEDETDSEDSIEEIED